MGIFEDVLDLQLTDKLPNVHLGTDGQNNANGVADNSLTIIANQPIVAYTIIGTCDSVLYGTQRDCVVGIFFFSGY